MLDMILLGRVAYQDFSAYWPFADPNLQTTLVGANYPAVESGDQNCIFDNLKSGGVGPLE